MVYGNPVGPVYNGSGIKLMTPVLLTVTIPLGTSILCATPEVSVTPLILVILSICPLGSVSLSNRSSTTGIFAGVVALSSNAIGLELRILICTIVSSVLPRVSVIVYGKITGPTNHGSGVNVINPVLLTFTTHHDTGMVCAVPGVSVTPLISVIVIVPLATSFISIFRSIC